MEKPRIKLFNNPNIAKVLYLGQSTMVAYVEDYDGGDFRRIAGVYRYSFISLEEAIKNAIETIIWSVEFRSKEPSYRMVVEVTE